MIRKRFKDAQVALLLQMRWWGWAGAEPAAAMPLQTGDAIADLHHHRQLNRV